MCLFSSDLHTPLESYVREKHRGAASLDTAQHSVVGSEASWVNGTRKWSLYQRYYGAKDNQTEIEGFVATKLGATQPSSTLPIHCCLKLQQSVGLG